MFGPIVMEILPPHDTEIGASAAAFDKRFSINADQSFHYGSGRVYVGFLR